MKKTLKIALLASSAIAIASTASANAGLQKLINNANNWAHPNGNFSLHRHSSLKQINKSNVILKLLGLGLLVFFVVTKVALL